MNISMKRKDNHNRLYDSVLERSIISAILIDEEAAQKSVVDLESSDFGTEAYRIIFDTVKRLFSEGKEINLINIIAELNQNDLTGKIGGIEAIKQIAFEADTGAEAGQWIERLIQLRHRRQAVEFSKQIYQAATENDIDEMYNAVSNIPDFSTSEKEKSTKEIMNEAVSRIAERYSSEKKKIPGNETGFYDLDKVTGGIKNGELVLLSADPNVGKSILSHQIAINFAKNKKNAEYFNFEMNDAQIGDRTLAIALPLEINKIKYPKEYLTQKDLEFIENCNIDEILDKHLHIYSKMRSRTLAAIRAKCKEAKVKYGKINLIVIDYLQLMDGEGEDRERIERNCRGLKNLASEFDCPVIAISSLSRNGELRGSGQLDFDADQKWHLKREHDAADEMTRARTELIIKKNRDGGKGTINLTFQEKYVRFYCPERMY